MESFFHEKVCIDRSFKTESEGLVCKLPSSLLTKNRRFVHEQNRNNAEAVRQMGDGFLEQSSHVANANRMIEYFFVTLWLVETGRKKTFYDLSRHD